MRMLQTLVFASASQPPVLRRASDATTSTISEQKLRIGPSSSTHPVAHPKLADDVICAVYMKSARIFARVDAGAAAEAADDDLGLNLSLLNAASGVFLEGREMRPGVDYLVSANSTLCFGEDGGECFVVEFEEEGSSGGDAMSKMLMQGMAAGASQDVRDALKDKM